MPDFEAIAVEDTSTQIFSNPNDGRRRATTHA